MDFTISGVLITNDMITQWASDGLIGVYNAFVKFQDIVYLIAAVLFILALAGLSKQESAKRGNYLGIAGMVLVLVVTAVFVVFCDQEGQFLTIALILAALAIGGCIGIYQARKVKMTAMPELVALLHSFVGAAAVLVGFNSTIMDAGFLGSEGIYHAAEVGLAVFIGAVTLSGSIVAYLKLSGKISGAPLMVSGRNATNLGLLLICLFLIVTFAIMQYYGAGLVVLIALMVFSLLLGAHLVLAIGGGDMPVVISMLNSYSGWAAAMAGLTLYNNILVITGALVGSSGAYLSYIMCQGMNRSFTSVILGGYGTDASSSGSSSVQGTHTEIDAEEVAQELRNAKRVVIAPGYGMAVSQAQFPVAELTRRLTDAGVDVRFAIHPVAGRMPGHMNVLLAEAKIPYSKVFELDEINDEFSEVDVVLVIGANDTVNPMAETDPNSPIAGMPVLRVWEADKVIVFKRSMGNAGYAGVQNPLFFRDNSDMLLGDAKDSVEAINAALR